MSSPRAPRRRRAPRRLLATPPSGLSRRRPPLPRGGSAAGPAGARDRRARGCGTTRRVETRSTMDAVRASFGLAGLLAALALLAAGCGGGGGYVAQAAPVTKPQCAYPRGWQRLANRIGAP